MAMHFNYAVNVPCTSFVRVECCRYEVATGEPLIHEESNTHIYLHSVNKFHAASVDCTRSMMQLLRPSMLAVGVSNSVQQDFVVDAQARMQLVRSKEHVQRIADGYHRICMGMHPMHPSLPAVLNLRHILPCVFH